MDRKLRLFLALCPLALVALLACSDVVAPCTPTQETCNHVDDDCDGQTDEDLERACETTCGPGTESCTGGEWAGCSAPQPSEEVCNNADDDCNDQIDDGLTACACTGGNPPGTEDCNGTDDDCDTHIDEDLTRACSTDCGDGTETCISGSWLNCDAPQPEAEVCNNSDDDCDGQTDNDLTACACTGGNPAGAEDCNGIDDDCNQAIDDAVDTTCSTLCGDGTRECVQGAWTDCTAPLPQAEVCNNDDDDCDGQIDNAVPDCQCTDSNPPGPEVCDGIDNNCNQQIDEDDGTGRVCGVFGDPCQSFRQCSSQICVGDVFERTCSAICDPADPSTCPAGHHCHVGPNQDYCLRDHAACEYNGDCLPDQVCTIQDAPDGLSMATECRPPLDPGGDPGDACDGPNPCANNLCLWIDICSEVCSQTDHCSTQYLGHDTTCILRAYRVDPGECARDAQCPSGYTCSDSVCLGPTCSDDGECETAYACDPDTFICTPDPFFDYVGQCMIECTSDTDCPTDLVCQAGVLIDRSRIQGFCYNPYSGNPTGDNCDPGCDHGICYHGANNDYCTQICGNPDDCPAGMDCTPGTLYMGSLGEFPDTYTCTFP